VFAGASSRLPIPLNRGPVLEILANQLGRELEREISIDDIERGLYADLAENRVLERFDPPAPETLLHRYNLSQVQGVFYRADHITIHVHRNDPGEYKYLFRYLKLFRLMTYIEGDADTGFTITIDGPASLFAANTRYGVEIAKVIPALLHVAHWSLEARLPYKNPYSGRLERQGFRLDESCGLVSHYSPGKPYDSLLEESFARRWSRLNTAWKLEREVDLVPVRGSVMIPDFRLVHPDGRDFLLEIVGYWRPEYLRKKFWQARSHDADNLILAVSERLNLERAGVKLQDLPARVIWFKDKLSPRAVVDLLENGARPADDRPGSL
jgi:predicted nuclease of restriction endonuclease-like RecB superfamily